MLYRVEYEKSFITSGPENINYTIVKYGETFYSLESDNIRKFTLLNVAQRRIRS